jgi:hypothetical protein
MTKDIYCRNIKFFSIKISNILVHKLNRNKKRKSYSKTEDAFGIIYCSLLIKTINLEKE